MTLGSPQLGQRCAPVAESVNHIASGDAELKRSWSIEMNSDSRGAKLAQNPRLVRIRSNEPKSAAHLQRALAIGSKCANAAT
jgi:hypothetical protein